MLPGTEFQVLEGIFTAQVVCDPVACQRISGGQSFRIAAPLFDGLGSFGAFPQADEPETGEALVCQVLQFFFRDLVQMADIPSVFL